MRINVRKLISDLLITFTRDNKFIELIRVLISQAESSLNEFNVQVPDWMYKAKANASVISLQHHIKRELDVDVLITELDGTPIDFLVTVSGFADQNQIAKIIDTYGLAGKSYVFEDGEITYTCEWINHVCVLSLIDNAITISLVDSLATVSAAFAVTSKLTVYARFDIRYSSPIYHTFVLDIGATTSGTFSVIGKVVTGYSILSVTPIRDNNYNYTNGGGIIPV